MSDILQSLLQKSHSNGDEVSTATRVRRVSLICRPNNLSDPTQPRYGTDLITTKIDFATGSSARRFRQKKHRKEFRHRTQNGLGFSPRLCVPLCLCVEN
jgi:hypothetical protein